MLLQEQFLGFPCNSIGSPPLFCRLLVRVLEQQRRGGKGRPYGLSSSSINCPPNRNQLRQEGTEKFVSL